MEHWKNLSLETLSEVYEGILYVEEWRPITGYNGLYECSSFGRIKSLRLKYIDSNGRKYNKQEKIIRQQDDFKRGYLKVRIYKNAIARTYSVHRLIATAFIPNSELNWSTSSDNQQHAYDVLNRNKPLLGKFGKDHHTSIKINQYDLSGNLIKRWDSINDIERAGVGTAGAIIRCLKGRSKSNQSKGFKWEYAKTR